MAGGAAATYPSAVGDILSAQREEGGEMDLGSAALGGVPYAALNVLGLEGAAARGGLFRYAAGRLDEAGGVRGGLVRAGATGARVGFSEGVSETGQESVNQYFGRMAANPDETMFNPEAMDRYAESFVGGALLGGSVGAAAGGWRRSEGYQPNIPSADQPGGTDLLQGDRPAFQLDYSAVPVGPDMPLPPGAGPVNAADPRQVAMFDERGMPTYNADPSFGFGLEAAETANPTRDPTFAPTGGELSQPGFQMEAFRPQGQGELFSYDPLPPGGPEALPAEPPAPPTFDTRSGDMFDSRPTATVQTDFSTPALLRELRVAHENKTDGWLTKFANGLSKVITDPAKAAEFLENAQEDNISSRASQATTARRDKVLAAARQTAQRFQSRMLDAQAQEGAARARPGVRVGQQPISTATAEQMRQRNQSEAFEEQLSSTDERVLASRRRGLLDAVLGDATTRNPLGRFTAMLKRNGLDATVSAEEQQRISRYMDARAGLTGQGQGELRLEGEPLGGRTLPTAEPNAPATEKAGQGQPKTQLGLDFEGEAKPARAAKAAPAPESAPAPAPAPAAAEPSYDGVAVELTVDAGGKTRKLKIADAGKKLRELRTKRDKYQQLLACLTR